MGKMTSHFFPTTAPLNQANTINTTKEARCSSKKRD